MHTAQDLNFLLSQCPLYSSCILIHIIYVYLIYEYVILCICLYMCTYIILCMLVLSTMRKMSSFCVCFLILVISPLSAVQTEDFLPFSWLPLHPTDHFLHCTEAFQFDVILLFILSLAACAYDACSVKSCLCLFLYSFPLVV